MGLYSFLKNTATTKHKERKMSAEIPKHADSNFQFKRTEFEKFVKDMRTTDRQQMEDLFGKDKFKKYFQHGGKSWREIKQDLKKAGSKYDQIRKDTEKEIIKQVTPDKGKRRQIIIQRALDPNYYDKKNDNGNKAVSVEAIGQKGAKRLKLGKVERPRNFASDLSGDVKVGIGETMKSQGPNVSTKTPRVQLKS